MKFRFSKFFSSDIGIDLGTANCLVYVKDHGIVLVGEDFDERDAVSL